ASSSTPLQAETGLPKAGRLPVGVVAFATSIYALLYLVWEQSHWGSPRLRDIIGNVAFMPLNLSVLALFALASGQTILDPGVRRALRLLALGAAMVFI